MNFGVGEQLCSTTRQVLRLFHLETLAVWEQLLEGNRTKPGTWFVHRGMFYCRISKTAGRDAALCIYFLKGSIKHSPGEACKEMWALLEAVVWWKRSELSLSSWGGWIQGCQGKAQLAGSGLLPSELCTLRIKRNCSCAAQCSNAKHNRPFYVNFWGTAAKYILWHLRYILHSGLTVKRQYVSVKPGQPYFTVSRSASQLVGTVSALKDLSF